MLENIDYKFWLTGGKPLFSPNEKSEKEQIHNIPKSVYAPLPISIDSFPFHQRIYHHLLHTRPKWYKKYHTYPISQYFHLAVLIIFMSAIGFSLYFNFFLDARSNKTAFASLSPPPRLLSFEGKLTDNKNNPIIGNTNVRFSIYSSATASGSALLWQETDHPIADKDGRVSLLLGKNNTIPQEIFSQHSGLWLGIAVETTQELVPRQQLASVAYAENAATLNGLPVITQENATDKNVILALDSSGNLTIGGNQTHTFQATSGNFKISGESLTLATNADSSKDIIIAPNGTGEIDIQKPLHNTSQYNNIQSAIGSVEVDDTFSILATSSGQSAFTINQNDIGPLISASSSGVSKFTVENDGSILTAGNISIAGSVNSNLVPMATNLSLGSNLLQWDAVYAKSFFINGRPLTQPFIENPDSVAMIDSTKNLLVGGEATTSAAFQVFGNTGDIQTSGNITLTGTSSAISTINEKTLTIGGTATGAVEITPNGNTGIFVNNLGSVGIGTISLVDQTALQVQKNTLGNALLVANQQGSGDIFTASASGVSKFTIANTGQTKIISASLCVNATNAGCVENTPGTIYASNTSLKPADIAENYVSSQTLDPGDIIAPEPSGNNFSITKSIKKYQSDIIGVISTKPGVTLNSDIQIDNNHRYVYPVALNGRVPIKVSAENGTIKPGDLLTSSSTPGVAMKAVHAGPIVGKALESFSGNTQGKIMAFISISWADPGVYLVDSGNFNIASSLETNTANYSQKDKKFVVTDSMGNVINQLAILSDSIIANLKTGIITANEIVTDNITSLTASIQNGNIDNLVISNKLISPIAQINEIHTNLISPLASNSAIAMSFDSNRITIQNDNNPVANIDNQGNASFSGAINSKNLNISENATISGVLRASKIIADQIEGLQNHTASQNAQYITNITNVYSATESSEQIASPSPSSILSDSIYNIKDKNYINIASYSGYLSYVPSLHVNTATFEQGLMSLGPTSLSDTSINGQLSIGSNFIVADNAINVLSGDLELQPLKQGGVSIAGRQIYIDSSGNITFNGNLSANVISPIPNHDLVINLGSSNDSQAHTSEFAIHNASHSGIFTVNQIGDIIASGAATVNKLNFNLAQAALAISNTEIVASSSAGVATISAHQTELTVDNPLVSEKSLIYITPVGESTIQTPFLLRQVPKQSFTVGIQEASFSPTTFNWLIVN